MHLIIFFVFTALTTNDVYSSYYIGCFKKTSENDKVMNGDFKTFHNTLTSHICITYCAGKGFTYAGLEYMHECHCSDEGLSSESAAIESECNMKCDGNREENCGGYLRISVYSTGLELSPNYLGCYIDGSREGRLLADELKIFPEMTPKICIYHCKGMGYDYAGLENRRECYCSNTRPSFKSSTNESDCDLKCAGNQNQKCGGHWRLSVYETNDKGVDFVKDNYLGCYLDIRAYFRSSNKYKTFKKTLTPEICVGFCYRSGYRYAAVQNGNQCFCGDHSNLAFLELPNSQCNVTCVNSNKLKCGGLWKNGVYRTNISDHSEFGNVIGCFIDNENRILPAVKMIFKEKCTPKLCFNICLQVGYKYSGVEAGYLCFCGNKRPDNRIQVAGDQCLTPCTGDSQKTCGGSRRILVYSINV